MRKGVTGDLVAGLMKPHDRVVRQAVPVIPRLVDQAAREVERAAAAMLFQERCALARGTVGRIIEGKADHRRMRRQPVRRSTEMPGQPIAHASLECRQHDCISCLPLPRH